MNSIRPIVRDGMIHVSGSRGAIKAPSYKKTSKIAPSRTTRLDVVKTILRKTTRLKNAIKRMEKMLPVDREVVERRASKLPDPVESSSLTRKEREAG